MSEIEELKRKWHKLLKLLNNKEIIDEDEKENLELESYLEKQREKWWSS